MSLHVLLETVFISRTGMSLRLDGDSLTVHEERRLLRRLPLASISAIVVFGPNHVSSKLIERCGLDGHSIAWFDRRGRFIGRLQGPRQGNVLLARDQHVALSDPQRTLEIARSFVDAKLLNSTRLIERYGRERNVQSQLAVGQRLRELLKQTAKVQDLDELRGIEGLAAREYFQGLRMAITPSKRQDFASTHRSRRPPLDPFNALLSFGYSLLREECAAALDGVGLDPQVGYLHALRPGRPALALDLQEEFRSLFIDRMVIAMINQGQVRTSDFTSEPSGATYLNERGRRRFLEEYHARRRAQTRHPELRSKLPIGLCWHVQARLLARWLRGDLHAYSGFTPRV